MITKVRLSHLAFACYVYIGMTNYDKTYKEFLDKTSPIFDMQNASHRAVLLKWLNDWGCRIPEKSFEEISEKLLTWFGKYKRSFPQEGKRLLDLSGEEIVRVAEVYKGLLEIKFIAATVASKILFALRSDVYPIWDNAMQKEYRNRGCSTYEEYMKQSREELKELSEECQRHGVELSELPSRLNREGESLLKLLDEYRWVFITRGLLRPSVKDFRDWYEWAK